IVGDIAPMEVRMVAAEQAPQPQPDLAYEEPPPPPDLNPPPPDLATIVDPPPPDLPPPVFPHEAPPPEPKPKVEHEPPKPKPPPPKAGAEAGPRAPPASRCAAAAAGGSRARWAARGTQDGVGLAARLPGAAQPDLSGAFAQGGRGGQGHDPRAGRCQRP